MPSQQRRRRNMCSLCPRKIPKKIVRFDSFVDTFSISDINSSSTQQRVSIISVLFISVVFNLVLPLLHSINATLKVLQLRQLLYLQLNYKIMI